MFGALKENQDAYLTKVAKGDKGKNTTEIKDYKIFGENLGEKTNADTNGKRIRFNNEKKKALEQSGQEKLGLV